MGDLRRLKHRQKEVRSTHAPLPLTRLSVLVSVLVIVSSDCIDCMTPDPQTGTGALRLFDRVKGLEMQKGH